MNEDLNVTVGELIEQLAKLPKDALVVVSIGDQEAPVASFSSDGERVAISGDVR